MISIVDSVEEIKSEDDFTRSRLNALLTRASEAHIYVYVFDSLDSALNYETACVQDELPCTIIADPATHEYFAAACV